MTAMRLVLAVLCVVQEAQCVIVGAARGVAAARVKSRPPVCARFMDKEERAALSEQQGLSAEQKSLLAQKETEIEKARRSKGAVANKKASVWQQRLDQAQLEQLEAK